MKTMKFSLLFAVAVLITFNSCSGLKVTSDYDPSVDFSKYKTFEYYGWEKESDKLLSDFDRDRFETAFGQEFKNRNIEYVKENGDLIVTLFVVVKERIEKVANTTHMGGAYGGGYYGGYYGYGPGYGWGMGHSSTTISEYNYKEGTIVIDVFDAKEKKLIWEGIGSKDIIENPKGSTERINHAVKQIMSKYPVKPVKK